MSKHVQFMPSLTRTGGASSGILSGIKNSFSSLSWRTIGVLVLVIILAIIGYTVYQYHIQARLKRVRI